MTRSHTPDQSAAPYHHGNLRSALIERAIAVIGQSGVEGLSLRGLARDLGVSHAAPARHFPAKADLLAAIVAEAYQDLVSAVSNAYAPHADKAPAEGLQAMALAAMRWAMAHPARFSVMTNPDVSRFASPEIRKALGAFSDAIGDGIGEAVRAKALDLPLPERAYQLFAIGAVLGIATILTDPLMRAVFGPETDEQTLANLADLIVPTNGTSGAGV